MFEADDDGCINGTSGAVCAEVVGVHRAVDIVQHVVHPCLQAVGEGVAVGCAEVVGGVEPPQLEGSAVAVVLVVAPAAAAGAKVGAQLVALVETVVPDDVGIPLVVGGTVDDDVLQPVVVGVVLVGAGLVPAIVAA